MMNIICKFELLVIFHEAWEVWRGEIPRYCASTILAINFHIIDPSYLVIFARGESFAEK